MLHVLQLTASPKFKGHDMRQPSGSTLMAMKFLWIYCASALPTSIKSTHKVQKCDHLGVVSAFPLLLCCIQIPTFTLEGNIIMMRDVGVGM